MKLSEQLGKKRLYLDGAMGTMLLRQGLAAGELPETWNVTHPEQLIALHEEYLLAGCDIISTNTFGANQLKFPKNGTYSLENIISAAVENAKTARQQSGREAWIALDIGPSGKLLQPMGDLEFEHAVELFAQTIRLGVAAGADLILIETMTDTLETKAAVLAAKENCDLPVLVSNTFDDRGSMLTGGSVRSVSAMLEGLRADACGLNCGLGPDQLLPLVRELCRHTSLPVLVSPNAGLPRSEDGVTVYDVTPEVFARSMVQVAECGAALLGGCCGTTPEHIRLMRETCEKIPFAPAKGEEKTVVSSFSQSVSLGDTTVVIGERINPTGKKRFQQALREQDMNYLLQEALAQEEHGAQILDVNVGLPGIDEADTLGRAVQEIQAVCPLPLQIDTSDTTAMERALRTYAGKPMINSVNGKKESMDAVLPLVAKYGGVLVGLPLDENGIPESAEGRVAIARKIIECAAQYGISKKDIVIDGLAMTVSSDPCSALVTLETIQKLKTELGVATILGVSNISFGLPARETINTAFFLLAMQQGLNCAIVNPNNAAMMQARYAFAALTDRDEQFRNYIAFCGNTAQSDKPVSPAGKRSLSEVIEHGLVAEAGDAAKLAVEAASPLSVISEQLVPALDRVGKKFESGTLFLPQLLRSADAAKAAAEVLQRAILKSGETRQKQKIILATVKGDIHDIGKNIVRVLLENYGYQVIDLGKDVAPETIVDTAVRENVSLVGLSALMTTTVTSMEKTIGLLRKEKPDAQIVVGGAVLTESYARQIGADCYAKDAMATVHFAQTIFPE